MTSMMSVSFFFPLGEICRHTSQSANNYYNECLKCLSNNQYIVLRGYKEVIYQNTHSDKCGRLVNY